MEPINPVAENTEAVKQNPKSSNHQNNITVISMAIFVLMCLSIVGYLYYQNQQLKSMLAKYQTQPTPSPTPAATEDPIANWKTYTNEKYGYEIKYPMGWVEIASETDPSNFSLDPGGTTSNTGSMHIDVGAKTSGITEPIENWIKKTNRKIDTSYNLTIGGEKVVKTIEGGGVYYYIFIHNKVIYQISVSTTDFPSELSKTIDQIVSTFKFLGQTPVATCKPRPSCLDATPRCLIPETSDMCPPASPAPPQKACTQEAKICPDGSSVGRTGPNCEFAPCPTGY
jgi:hypothetical protein